MRWTTFDVILAGKFRRFFKAQSGEKPRSDRFGSCNMCGDCCRMGWRCELLGPDNRCMDYDGRPLQCHAFPYDPEDIDDIGRSTVVVRCGFGFSARPLL